MFSNNGSLALALNMWRQYQSASPPPSDTYVAEDGTTVYVAEDGTTPYVPET